MEQEQQEHTTHVMKLQPGPFERIKSGIKDIEVRVFDEKRQQIKIDDFIEFSKMPDLQEKLTVKVTELIRRDTFSELFNDYEASRFGATGYEPHELVESMRQYYSVEEELKFGVVGIVIALTFNE